MTLFKNAIYANALTALFCSNIQAAENKTHLLENIKHEVVEDTTGKKLFVFSNIEYCQLKNSGDLDKHKLRRYERHFLQLGGTKDSISLETCIKVKNSYGRLTNDQVEQIMSEKFY